MMLKESEIISKLKLFKEVADLRANQVEHLKKIVSKPQKNDLYKEEIQLNKQTKTLSFIPLDYQVAIYSSCFHFPFPIIHGKSIYNEEVYVADGESIDEILDIISKNEIEFKKFPVVSPNFCETGNLSRGFKVPSNWHVDSDWRGEGCGDKLEHRIFLAFDKPIYSVLAYTKTSWTEEEGVHSPGTGLFDPSIYQFTKKEINRYKVEDFYLCSDCIQNSNQSLLKMIKQISKNPKILRLDDPKIYYDPRWLD